MGRTHWALALLAVTSCTFEVDPDQGRFSCDTAEDCGQGYECIDQVEGDRGRCFPLGACEEDETSCDGEDEDCNGAVDDVLWADEPCASGVPGVCAAGTRQCVKAKETCEPKVAPSAEACNGQDDDCDGATDEDFDFASDDEHCGGCNLPCGAGTTCRFALCAESDCGDGADDDGDLFVDCADSDCLGRVCDPLLEWVCGRVVPEAADGGVETDGGVDGGDGQDGGDEVDGGANDDGGTTADGGDLDGGDPDGGDPDGGDPDGGSVPVPACVPRETACGDGLDQDGDGLADCDDPDCESRACGDAGVCTQGACL